MATSGAAPPEGRDGGSRDDSTDRLSRRTFLRTAGAGAAAGSATSTAAAQTTTRAPQQRTVDMTDSLVFDPDSITIAPGDTVVWENVGSVGHTVTAYEDEIPGDAAYFASGGYDSEQAARSGYSPGDTESGEIPGGGTYRHTFEVVGSYGYFCIPHESVGMVGTVEVTPGGPSEGGGGVPLPTVPDTARMLVVAVSVAMLSVMALTYLFVKYGGDYELPERRQSG